MSGITSRRSVLAASAAGAAAVVAGTGTANAAGAGAGSAGASPAGARGRRHWDPISAKNSVFLLVDHQPSLLAGVNSHPTTTVINNVTGLAKAAKVFRVPTVLTSVLSERGGKLIPQIRDVFPGQEVHDRTTLNAWEDANVVKAIRKTGAKKIVIAALWTEICLAYPALAALDEGYEVYAVTDASGGTSVEAHDMAVRRMADEGVVPITWNAVMGELQRDWSHTATIPGVAKINKEHFGAFGAILDLEEQLLNHH
ncbi:hydrolase [Streptomyces sp. NPDC059909]|uniref:hydrolase n=1 Tax=Streptomyces sp. NPDC059909 TaxID=3346998 RepID=UPI003652BAE6